MAQTAGYEKVMELDEKKNQYFGFVNCFQDFSYAFHECLVKRREIDIPYVMDRVCYGITVSTENIKLNIYSWAAIKASRVSYIQ